MDLFHQRLAVELRDVLPGVHLYEIRPRWPDDLHNLHRSYEDMLLEAFEVDSLDNIPGRIRTQTQGESGRRILGRVHKICFMCATVGWHHTARGVAHGSVVLPYGRAM